MIILNTTFIIERDLEPEVTSWLKDVYIPTATSTRLFIGSRLARVLSNEDPMAISIACELTCESLSAAVRWHDVTAESLRSDMKKRWGEHVLIFTTYLRKL